MNAFGTRKGDERIATAPRCEASEDYSRPSASSRRFSYVCVHTKNRGFVCLIWMERKGERQGILCDERPLSMHVPRGGSGEGSLVPCL